MIKRILDYQFQPRRITDAAFGFVLVASVLTGEMTTRAMCFCALVLLMLHDVASQVAAANRAHREALAEDDGQGEEGER
jgi:hypothetical protein